MKPARKIHVRLVLAALLLLGVLQSSTPATAQQVGSACSPANKVIYPTYFTGTSQAYVCDGAHLVLLESDTAVPLQKGIGTASPQATLDVNGEVRVGNTGLACSATTVGAMRYNSVNLDVEYCNGTSWTGSGGGAGGALNNITAATTNNGTGIGNGSYAQIWNWALSSTGYTGMTFGESAASTAPGKLVAITTASGSDTVPLSVTNGATTINPVTINMSQGGLAVGGANVLALPDADTTSIAVGEGALAAQNATSQFNVAVGYEALQSAACCSGNVAVGYLALQSSAGSFGNTGVGFEAMQNWGGAQGTAIGELAMEDASGYDSVAVGNYTLGGGGASIFDVAIGYGAMGGYGSSPNTSNNVAVGVLALSSNVTAANNTAIGYQSLGLSTASPNDAFGSDAGEYITTGTDNVAIGNLAMAGNSGAPLTGSNNTAVGQGSLSTIQGGAIENTAVGTWALESNTTGYGNTAVGTTALAGGAYPPSPAGVALTGSNNTAVGDATFANAQGNAMENTGVGQYAGYGMTTGSDNTLLGYAAGFEVSGDGNIILGEYGPISTGGSNILIGNYIYEITPTDDNQLDIGDTIFADLAAGDVGIGTATPTSALDVEADGASEPLVNVGATNVAGFSSIAFSDAANNYQGLIGWGNPAYPLAANTFALGTVSMYPLVLMTNSLARLTIDGSGNVGIGTTSPSSLFQVGAGGTTGKFIVDSQDSDSGLIQIGNPASDGETGINFISGVTAFGTGDSSTNGDTHIWSIGAGSWGIGGGNFAIANDNYGGPILTISSGGKVGIGTTTPQATLDVNGYLRLAKNSSQPVACSSTNDGAVALTHVYTLCLCKGASTSWVQSKDGATACSW